MKSDENYKIAKILTNAVIFKNSVQLSCIKEVEAILFSKKIICLPQVNISDSLRPIASNLYPDEFGYENLFKINELYKKEIELADIIIVLDNYYITGVTARQIEYAAKLGKEILYYTDKPDLLCSNDICSKEKSNNLNINSTSMKDQGDGFNLAMFNEIFGRNEKGDQSDGFNLVDMFNEIFGKDEKE